MSETISKEDREFLDQIRDSDPEFVRQYLGEEEQMEETDADGFLGTSDCADFLKVCNNTVLYYIKNGKLAATQEYGRWKIKQEDLLNFIKTREQENNQGDDDMSNNTKSTSRLPMVIDFLHSWNKASSACFTLESITREFNKHNKDSITDIQMSNILSRMKSKKLIVSLGRGIYSVCENFFPNKTNQAAHSVPAIMEDEEVIESPESLNFEPGESLKKAERKAVEQFIEERFKEDEDLVFDIKDVVKVFPDMDRHLLAKALQNMKSVGKLHKGSELGVYIKKATKRKVAKPIVAPAPVSSSSYFDKIDEIRRSNMSEQLKEELVRKLA